MTSRDAKTIINDSNEYQKRVEEHASKDTVDRFYYFSMALSILFFIFGFTSIEFIKRFDPNVTLLSNLWPRLLFSSIPLLLLSRFLRQSKMQSKLKIYLWIAAFGVIFDVASLIHVWPIAWSGHPEIILYVNSTNNSLFAAMAMMVALPVRGAVIALSTIALVVWTPLFLVVMHGGDPLIFQSVIGDTIFLNTSAFVLGLGVNKAKEKLAAFEIDRQAEASKFLGKAVARAIFEDHSEILKETNIKGFIASIDIRDSTELQKKHGDRWRTFRKEYFAIVGRSVSKYSGHIQKTAGDSHIITFGIMDDSVDLSDVPGIETEEARAEERRLQTASDRAFVCMDEIFAQFQGLAKLRFPDESIRLGGGIDKGSVERSLQGDESTVLELDISGDAINCSNRLQEYTKAVREEFSPDSSLLAVSPFASDYIKNVTGFIRVRTVERPIRNYAQIQWVLVKEYSASVSVSQPLPDVETKHAA